MLAMEPEPERYDIIVSNPPYIADSERAGMESNVLDYEPPGALFVPDSDPLRFYRALAVFGQVALRPRGRLYFEINSRFSVEMRGMLQSLGYANVDILNDIYRLPRFAVAEKGEMYG